MGLQVEKKMFLSLERVKRIVGEEKTVYLVLFKDTHEVKSLGNYEPKEIEAAIEYCQENKYIPKSDDVKMRKKPKMPVVRVKTPYEESNESQKIRDLSIVTEYTHTILPTDCDTLTSEDSTVSDLNGVFRSARADFHMTFDSTRDEAKETIQDHMIDETFNLAVKQTDNVKKSLSFDTGTRL